MKAAGRDMTPGFCTLIGRAAAGLGAIVRGAITLGRGIAGPFPNPFENPPPDGLDGFILPIFSSLGLINLPN
jgi:hypothetical protein